MKRFRDSLLIAIQLCLVPLLTVFITTSAQAQTPAAAANDNRSDSTRTLALMPRFKLSFTPPIITPANAGSGSNTNLMPVAAGSNLQVLGSGTLGRLTKWTGLTSANSFIGNSTIFENKDGLVGIGTDSPTSRLTVQGMIETTTGGLKFPDGTVQTTSAAGAMFSVAHDHTLTGNGTTRNRLAVAVPLILIGGVSSEAVIYGSNTAEGGAGITGIGGITTSIDVRGGTGVFALGGGGPLGGRGVVASGGSNIVPGNNGPGGEGVVATGGDSDRSVGGSGILANGGNNVSNFNLGGAGAVAQGGRGIAGGEGVRATGGSGERGGAGVRAVGGSNAFDGDGGEGVLAFGGTGGGTGRSGGPGIVVRGGSGVNDATTGPAGLFTGDVRISGDLSVNGTKNFKIDHPLDPENKYLYHAAIESSEVLNVYSGNITTDASGEATVTLPDWFEAINRDFRYQLTVVGTFAQAIVAEKVKGNRFTIKTNAPNVEVSWQVTGIRSDAAMRRRAFKVEEDKPERERGTYLNPEAFNQPEERGVEWARHPEVMRQMKEEREKASKAKQNLFVRQ